MIAIRCHSREELLAQFLKKLPRGRAWQTHQSGPQPESVLYQFWESVAAFHERLEARVCDLLREFWCASHVETHDLWMLEYGLPDACDPYPDLCAKVSMLGGARCEDYSAIAERAGWEIECVTTFDDCGEDVGEFEVGCDSVGGTIPAAELIIRVYLNRSRAYVGEIETGPYMGDFEAGMPLACDPDISALQCILARVIHAHLKVTYEVFDD